MGQAIDFESIDKGSPLEGLSIPALTRGTLARFAGAVDDYNPMHLDDKVATAAGKASVFAPANLVMAYIGRMVETYFEGASIRRYGLRMLKLVWPGDVLTCRGVVIDKRQDGKECVIDADVWADNQRGETVAKGRVIAVVPPSKKKGLTRAEAAAGVVYVTGKARHPRTANTKPTVVSSNGAGRAAKKASTGAKKTTAKKATKKTAKKVTKASSKAKTTKKKTTKKRR